MELNGLTSKKTIKLPLYGPVELALQNLMPDLIELTVIDSIKKEEKNSNPLFSIIETLNYIVSPFFITFYENNYLAAEAKFTRNYSIWPSSWRMGWVVRNALSHNRKIYFRDMSTTPISWREATISPADQNIEIEKYLNFTDILLLLFDMEADLA